MCKTREVTYLDIGKEVEFSDDKDFKRSYQDELVDIEQIENETYYRSKQGIWSYCRHIKKTIDVKELLHFIDAEARRVCAIEYGLPLYDEQEELLIYKVQEFIDNSLKG